LSARYPSQKREMRGKERNFSSVRKKKRGPFRLTGKGPRKKKNTFPSHAGVENKKKGGEKRKKRYFTAVRVPHSGKWHRTLHYTSHNLEEANKRKEEKMDHLLTQSNVTGRTKEGGRRAKGNAVISINQPPLRRGKNSTISYPPL